MSNAYCECEYDSTGAMNDPEEYDEITERPFMYHKPHKCKCVNNLQLYKRADGTKKYLCSCCWLISDDLIVQ